MITTKESNAAHQACSNIMNLLYLPSIKCFKYVDMKKEHALTLLLFCYFTTTAITQTLLKDINTTTLSTYFGPQSAVLNGTAFFGANAGDGKGNELWKSDGTASGTLLVKDIYAGDSHASPSNFLALADKILFTAQEDMLEGDKIFTTDGTASGTLPLLFANQPILGAQFVQANGAGFFTMRNPGLGTSLMRTDGTPQGTVPWSSTEPYASIIETPVIVGTYLYNTDHPITRTDTRGLFRDGQLKRRNPKYRLPDHIWANTPDEGFALWKSDGSVAGTVPVTDLEPGQTGGTPLVGCNGRIYFTTNRFGTDERPARPTP